MHPSSATSRYLFLLCLLVAFSVLPSGVIAEPQGLAELPPGFVLDELPPGFEVVPTDLATTRKAAKQGDAAAQYLLGKMYNDGEGVTKDYKQALNWFTKSAKQGNAEAQYWLGLMYAGGTGVPQDYREAVEWYTKAAEQGYAWAQHNLELIRK